MGFIFGIIGTFALLILLLVAVSFWLLAVILFTAFVMGGITAMALFGGGQDAFYIGGLISAMIALVVVGVYSNRVEERKQ